MPRISQFLGISIYMYYDDHQPPHFHAIYNEYAGIFSIENGKMIAGELPPRIVSLVEEWAQLRKQELVKDWEAATKYEKLDIIPPLV